MPPFPQIRATALAGCLELTPFSQTDARGRFLKLYHEPSFRALGLAVDWPEDFVSVSGKGVIRGMHFQAPPFEHVKLVTCLAGRVLDVVLDLRADSATYGQCAALELSAAAGNGLYIPAGFAHGFLALEEDALVHYKVSCAYAPDHDHGILASSIPFAWPVASPILSNRDRAFPALADFVTPFRS
jgi:dTDP-4-dehydrorhamnose 3,5-epimerase